MYGTKFLGVGGGGVSGAPLTFGVLDRLVGDDLRRQPVAQRVEHVVGAADEAPAALWLQRLQRLEQLPGGRDRVQVRPDLGTRREHNAISVCGMSKDEVGCRLIQNIALRALRPCCTYSGAPCWRMVVLHGCEEDGQRYESDLRNRFAELSGKVYPEVKRVRIQVGLLGRIAGWVGSPAALGCATGLPTPAGAPLTYLSLLEGGFSTAARSGSAWLPNGAMADLREARCAPRSPSPGTTCAGTLSTESRRKPAARRAARSRADRLRPALGSSATTSSSSTAASARPRLHRAMLPGASVLLAGRETEKPRCQESGHKTFKIKQKLAKKLKQNRPIPQWIRMRTGNTIRYNAKRRHWRRTKLKL
ncbi:60S ribosomal protein L39 [Frankliniella fusca]|nr:60S ribosomal protein L39 [Frankliniella fusca]